MAAKNRGGIVADEIIPGAFYQSVFPGHVTDAMTGISIPGPKVKIDTLNKRTVTGIESLPDPVQLPHKKRIMDFKDRDRKVREEVEVSFDARGDYPYHEFFNQALGVGLIRHVPDDEVKELYPNAWAKREACKVFSLNVEQKSMADIISDFSGSAEHRKQIAEAKKRERGARANLEAEDVNKDAGLPPPPPSA